VFQDHIVGAVLLFLLYQASNGTWSGVGYTYQAEVFPTRVRALAVGWMSAMLVGGFMLGSVLWAALTATLPLTVVWLVIAVGFGAAQAVSTFFLPHVESGRDLEEIAA
jgi:MFS family permease